MPAVRILPLRILRIAALQRHVHHQTQADEGAQQRADAVAEERQHDAGVGQDAAGNADVEEHLGPTKMAPTRAMMPPNAWRTRPPAKSWMPICASQPEGFHTHAQAIG